MVPTVTLLYGAVLAVLVGLLRANVSIARLRKRLFVGAALDPRMQMMVRTIISAAGATLTYALVFFMATSALLHHFRR